MNQPSLLYVAAAVVLGLPPASAQDDRERVLRAEITAEVQLAVARGLRHLVARQSPSGEFDSEVPVAAGALVGLAFLAGGYGPRAGPAPYPESLSRCSAALLRRQERGYFDDSKSGMYGHGFATLYLAELYGTPGGDDDTVRSALRAAIEVIEGSQGSDGGWDYDPSPRFSSRGGRFGVSDTSITVCQTLALRAARNLGLAVSGDTISRARSFILKAQNPDGGFKYRLEGGGPLGGEFQASAFPRSAAGVCILHSFGDYGTAAVRRGLDYLDSSFRFPWSNRFPYYAHYYCAQAMFQAGGRHWTDYFPWIRSALLAEQRADGSWRAGHLENDTQATAMALIVLQMPYRFLPIHER